MNRFIIVLLVSTIAIGSMPLSTVQAVEGVTFTIGNENWNQITVFTNTSNNCALTPIVLLFTNCSVRDTFGDNQISLFSALKRGLIEMQYHYVRLLSENCKTGK